MKTLTLPASASDDLSRAVLAATGLLERGEVVALPTETVYGLAADALNPDAVLKIFAAKERPFFDPLIVHLPAIDWLPRITEREPGVERLIERFWPGPLTLVLPKRESVPDLVTSGLPTVAVRMSANSVFRAVIERFGKPLAAPSANRFGRISPTAARHVSAELDGRIPLILDGGPTRFGLESTIISVRAERICVLRSGPITPEQLAEFGSVEFSQMAGKTPDAPGQLKSHYAPRTPLVFADVAGECSATPMSLLGFVPVTGKDYSRFVAIEWLSESGDLREAAATLFAKLRRLDESGAGMIVAEPVPEEGLGIAIMDRLRKAAHRDPCA